MEGQDKVAEFVVNARNPLLRNAGEAFNILDLKIGKAIHYLNFVVWKALDELPFARSVRKGGDLFNMEIGKSINNLDLKVRETVHELNFSIDPRKIDVTVSRWTICRSERERKNKGDSKAGGGNPDFHTGSTNG